MIEKLFLYLVSFSVFVVLQSLAINGIYDCFRGSAIKDDVSKKISYQGMVLYKIAPTFFEKYKYREWSKPLYSCIRCMASVYGALTYFPTVIYFWGFKWIEIPVFLFDIFILVYLNFYFYKKL
jgi:hypothetical protein